MSIMKKLFTAVRGAATEAGEAAVDNQALRILDQEIRDADQELRAAKDSMATIMAKRKRAEQKIAGVAAEIASYESAAMSALDKGDEALATEVAERIAELESANANEETLLGELKNSENHLRSTISKTEAGLKRMKQQVETVKATEAVQKAQSSIAARHSGANSNMRGALDSLERLKERQADRAARFDAAQELADAETSDDLDAKLKQAGIMPGDAKAGDVLARLRAKRA